MATQGKQDVELKQLRLPAGAITRTGTRDGSAPSCETKGTRPSEIARIVAAPMALCHNPMNPTAEACNGYVGDDRRTHHQAASRTTP